MKKIKKNLVEVKGMTEAEMKTTDGGTLTSIASKLITPNSVGHALEYALKAYKIGAQVQQIHASQAARPPISPMLISDIAGAK